jgi:arginine repressor
MKKVILIDTELGNVPVIINKVSENNEILFNGTILGENNIFIQARTEEFCIDQLRKSFECAMHFWIRYELVEIGLIYEGKINKNWYNE